MTASAPETTSSTASNAAPAAAPAQNAAPAKPAAPVADAPKAEAPKPTEAAKEPAKQSFADMLEAATNEQPAEVAATADFELKVPEGADEHVVGFVKDAARIAGIAPDKAQAVLDHVNKTLIEKREAAAKQVREDFARQLYEDKEWGGPKFKETVAASEAFLRRFVPEAAQKELQGKAIPAFLRIAFAKAHKQISPDRMFVGTQGSASAAVSESEQARVIFPRSLGQKG